VVIGLIGISIVVKLKFLLSGSMVRRPSSYHNSWLGVQSCPSVVSPKASGTINKISGQFSPHYWDAAVISVSLEFELQYIQVVHNGIDPKMMVAVQGLSARVNLNWPGIGLLDLRLAR